MREARIAQCSLFDPPFVRHAIGEELAAASRWLDEHPEVLALIERDVAPGGLAELGRAGLSLEIVLRCAFLKQYRQVSYRELAFLLQDSRSFQHFARVDPLRVPKKSALQQTISRIQASSWEAINMALLRTACEERIEKGHAMRVDATVTETNILKPADSQLLRDGMRVMVRALREARRHLGTVITFRDHKITAKRRHLRILSSRKPDDRARCYRELITKVHQTLDYVDAAWKQVDLTDALWALGWLADVRHYRDLILKVIHQTERRVFQGESVPATEKIVSLFEPHTDIIVKKRRETEFGHKLTLSTGASGLVLDVVIEDGNPADTECLLPMVDRHVNFYGEVPKRLAVDGGYASKANLDAVKQRGVEDAVFHKKRGLKVEAMTAKRWLYHKLRRFRAGIEAGISYLKRCFGLSRCNWKGFEHYKSYVWSSVFAHNLVVLGRRRKAPT